jgi:hypothetical protein
MRLHPKVAESHAKSTLAEVSRLGFLGAGGFEDAFFEQLMQRRLGALPSTDKGARRAAAEALDLVRRNALYVEHGEHKRWGPFVRWIGMTAGKKGVPADSQVDDTQEYIRLGTCSWYFRRDAFAHVGEHRRTLAVYAQHAIARHHQRDGHTNWLEVSAAIRQTLPWVWAMRAGHEAAGLQQVYAATSGGWFVGELDRYVDTGAFLRFKSYLSNATDPARWTRASQDLAGVLGRLPAERYGCWLCLPPTDAEHAGLVREVAAVLQAERHRWLRQPYAPGADRDAQAWMAHRGYS